MKTYGYRLRKDPERMLLWSDGKLVEFFNLAVFLMHMRQQDPKDLETRIEPVEFCDDGMIRPFVMMDKPPTASLSPGPPAED